MLSYTVTREERNLQRKALIEREYVKERPFTTRAVYYARAAIRDCGLVIVHSGRQAQAIRQRDRLQVNSESTNKRFIWLWTRLQKITRNLELAKKARKIAQWRNKFLQVTSEMRQLEIKATSIDAQYVK